MGKLADLMLVDGDPTQDIADVRKVARVLTQGHWIAPPEVHEALGIRPFGDHAPAVRRLTPPAPGLAKPGARPEAHAPNDPAATSAPPKPLTFGAARPALTCCPS